jgi:hypothetical protein
MPRQARLLSEEDAWYHVMNRAAGDPTLHPLEEPRAQQKLLDLVRLYTSVYSCRLGAYTLMGNHYHLVVFMEKYRELSREELERRARRLYGRGYRSRLRCDKDWERFNKRLFKLSELMRNIDGQFTAWYNPYCGRRGGFWADRYKSVWLEDLKALQDCLLYVELNPVRAGLVELPEQWRAGSAWSRAQGKTEGLVPLSEVFVEENPGREYESYRGRLLYRGMEPGREGQAQIPAWVVEAEQQRGFAKPGVFRQSLRWMTDGVVLGSRSRIDQVLGVCQERGIYQRRSKAVSQLEGLFFTLREQRRRRNLSLVQG